MVEDSLSHMTMGSVSHIQEEKKHIVKYVHRVARLSVRLKQSPNGGFVVDKNSKLVNGIRTYQVQ